MITIDYNLSVEISLQKLVNVCTKSQLYELDLLLGKRLKKIEKEEKLQNFDFSKSKQKQLSATETIDTLKSVQ